MATPPTRVGLFSTVYNTTTSPKTPTLTGIQVGDLVTAFVITDNNASPAFVFTPTATGVTFTLRGPSITGTANDRCWVSSWSGVVTSAGSPTLTFTRTTGSATPWWGGEATVWRNHGGLGAFNTNVSNAAPSLALTCSDNSAVACVIGDWSAGATTGKTWRTINGTAMVEALAVQQDPARYTTYSGYHLDVGAAGSQTLGMTAPTQRYSIAGMEVLGVTAAATRVPTKVYNRAALNRSYNF